MADRSTSLTLHLLRHAHAGDSTTWSGPDEERPLTKRGRHQAERLGRFLAKNAIRPDAIVSSPKVRALQTAEIVADTLDLPVRVDLRLGDGYDLVALGAIATGTGVAAPMLVGHDPDLSFALAALCRGDGLTMRKGALATIDVRLPFVPGAGTLRWLIPPELLVDD
jgi:phosphohistidine phosphatase